MTASLDTVASHGGLTDWAGFQLPVAVVFATMSGSAGLNLATDIERGYFDKLLLTPVSRVAILVGAMAGDLLRIVAQAALVMGLAMASGVDVATGALGRRRDRRGSRTVGNGVLRHRIRGGDPDRQPPGHAGGVGSVRTTAVHDHHVRAPAGHGRLAAHRRNPEPGHLHPRRDAGAHRHRMGTRPAHRRTAHHRSRRRGHTRDWHSPRCTAGSTDNTRPEPAPIVAAEGFARTSQRPRSPPTRQCRGSVGVRRPDPRVLPP